MIQASPPPSPTSQALPRRTRSSRRDKRGGNLRARSRSISPPPPIPRTSSRDETLDSSRCPRAPSRSNSADEMLRPSSMHASRQSDFLNTNSNHRKIPSSPKRRPAKSQQQRQRPVGLWQWTKWSVAFVFRMTSIAGLIMFLGQYGLLAAGINVEMKMMAHVDWNVLGLESVMSGEDETKNVVSPLVVQQQQQKQQQQQEGGNASVEQSLKQKQAPKQSRLLPIGGNNPAIPNDVATATISTTATTQPAPLKQLNVTLPPWVICPDGRNVTSCHACAATNTPQLLGTVGCASKSSGTISLSPSYCQWCPYGAAWDTTMTAQPAADQGVMVYDDQGQASKVFHAHVPLGAQCVSARQTCRTPPSSGSLQQQVWQQDVQLLQDKPFVAEMAKKAAPYTNAKQCTSRGFRFCPYGSLHAYHEISRQASSLVTQQTETNNITMMASPIGRRPPQCIPRRLHCQPPDDLFVQPDDRLYQQQPTKNKHQQSSFGAVVIPRYKLIFLLLPHVASSSTWLHLLRRMTTGDKDDHYNDNGSTGLTYLSDYSRADATDMWTSPAWIRAIMIRDPKERLLEAYLEHIVRSPTRHVVHEACCPETNDCATNSDMTFAQFLDMIVNRDCVNNAEYWSGQYERMERKYWSHVNMILQSNQAAEHTRQLLEQVGAWSDLAPIFDDNTERYGNNTTAQLAKYYDSPAVEAQVEELFYKDYRQKRFGFVRRNIAAATGQTGETGEKTANKIDQTEARNMKKPKLRKAKP